MKDGVQIGRAIEIVGDREAYRRSDGQVWMMLNQAALSVGPVDEPQDKSQGKNLRSRVLRGSIEVRRLDPIRSLGITTDRLEIIQRSSGKWYMTQEEIDRTMRAAGIAPPIPWKLWTTVGAASVTGLILLLSKTTPATRQFWRNLCRVDAGPAGYGQAKILMITWILASLAYWKLFQFWDSAYELKIWAIKASFIALECLMIAGRHPRRPDRLEITFFQFGFAPAFVAKVLTGRQDSWAWPLATSMLALAIYLAFRRPMESSAPGDGPSVP